MRILYVSECLKDRKDGMSEKVAVEMNVSYSCYCYCLYDLSIRLLFLRVMGKMGSGNLLEKQFSIIF